MWLGPLHELVVIGGSDEAASRAVLDEIQRTYLPHRVLAYRPTAMPASDMSKHLAPVFTGRTAVDGQPTLYVCENFACQAPRVGAAAIRAALEELKKA
jgi:uncharacterized protein YyaL (SSP411 family)